MAYTRRSGSRTRAPARRTRSTGRRAVRSGGTGRKSGGQTIRLVIETAPAAAVARGAINPALTMQPAKRRARH